MPSSRGSRASGIPVAPQFLRGSKCFATVSSSWIAWPLFPLGFQAALQTLRDCGYEGVELNLTEPIGIDLNQVASWTRELNLQVPSWLTGEAYSDGLCLSSADPAIRRATVERLIRYLDVAEQFGSILVVDSAGIAA